MTDGPAPSIAACTPTITALMGIAPPALCRAEPLPAVTAALAQLAAGGQVDRCLVYAPDAVGASLRHRYPADFELVSRHAPLEIELRAELPSKTPVCFASMFTGAGPEQHGIRQYEKPVLACDTLFDALLRAGKHVAIVTVRDSSIDYIFRQRELDLFSEDYDPQVTARALELFARDEHDFILVYHQEYDDTLHRATPFCDEALRAFRRHLASFAELAEAAAEHWRRHTWAIAFSPDHGAHVDPDSGKGTHGSDLPDDLEVRHFWGLFAPAAS